MTGAIDRSTANPVLSSVFWVEPRFDEPLQSRESDFVDLGGIPAPLLQSGAPVFEGASPASCSCLPLLELHR